MTTAASVLCSFAALACASPLPDVKVLQTAYEREADAPATTHDRGLKIVEADCRRAEQGSKHTCYVTFTSVGDKSQRLYFDAIAVEKDGETWRLKSGLCRK